MPQPPRSALLLTAGLGTRLAPLTEVRAKPAVPVAGEPLVRRISRWLARQGVHDLVLNLHHLPASITRVMGDGRDLDVRVRYSWEQPVVLGSAGGPRHALPLMFDESSHAGRRDRTFLIVNGDTLTDVNLPALASAHASSGALVTLAVTPNREPLRYGGLTMDAGSRVTGVVARGPAARDSFHVLGVQIAHADAFASLPAGTPFASIGGVYTDLIVARPGSIAGFVSDAAFWDVGTVSDYWRTSLDFIHREGGRGWHGQRSRIDPRAQVMRSILWDGVTVGAGCVLDECIVTDDVQVPPGMACSRSIIRVDPAGGLAIAPFKVT
jgi:NDP-sugar pyrophosphorylase family protein